MAFEILERAESVSPRGSFQTRGDQTKFRSAFYPEGTGPEVSVMSQDGRARLGFKEWVSDKGSSRNIVTVPMMSTKMKEYIVPVEDALEFEKYAGALSVGKVETYLSEKSNNMAPNGTPADVTNVGFTSGGSQSLQTVYASNQ